MTMAKIDGKHIFDKFLKAFVMDLIQENYKVS